MKTFFKARGFSMGLWPPSINFAPINSILVYLLASVWLSLGHDPFVSPHRIKSSDSLFIVKSFIDGTPNQHLTHLTVDKNTGTVYVGGVNRLYQLDHKLELIEEVITGPVNDSLECSSISCSRENVKNLKSTDNYNKVLVIDYTRSRLIVCGTVRQGSCEVRDLRDIKRQTRNISEAIAANNSTASTVAFIAPGPPNPPVTHVLYIGVTYTAKSAYRDEIPAVSSRSLEEENFFEFLSTNALRPTRIFINKYYREIYPITYVYGFGSDKFSYFLTRQKQNTDANSPYISKLVRVCQNDSEYYSYTEIPVECKDTEGKRYNLAQAAYVGKPGTDLATQLGIQTNDDVLFAVFSPSDPKLGEDQSKPASESALCVYSLTSIRRMFISNIQECFRGNGYVGMVYILSNSQKCTFTRINDISDDFCGMEVNTPLAGKQPIESVAVLTFPKRLTAVATTSTEVYTVVFLGTEEGHLKKVVIENQKNALEYGDIELDPGEEVKQDMLFDKAGDHLYVMTDKKVLKVKAQECSIYVGCNQCLGARDPYCGWCSLENKCSLRRDCRDATQDPQHWVSYKTGRCTTVTSVSPNKLQRTTARTLSLSIENLPSVEGSLECVFSTMGKELTTDARRTAPGVSCTTPRNDMLPDIPPNEHHFGVTLSVRKKNGPEFVSTNFTFFDCNTYSSCTECVSSDYPCDWCVDAHRCTHDAAENCRNDVLVNGINRIGPSIRSGKSFCPKIKFEDSKEILVSSGTEKTIRVKVENIAQFITQTSFVCQFNIEGRVTSVKAQLLSDTIYCDGMEFQYNTKAKSTNATFAVIWGGSKPLDNPDNIHVLVYQCRQMADNCGMCLSLPSRYRCGWCQSTKTCEVQDQCSGQSWLNRNQTCPNILITNFYPKSGPWDGGTSVTIEGVNLGKNLNDIYNGITVAGIPCQPYENSYVKTKKVTCKVDSPGVNDFKEGTIIVKVAKEYRGESTEKYQFVDPILTGLSPTTGPKAGGTLLNIQGYHMNAGSNITARINGRPCEIESVQNMTATCKTTASNVLLDRGRVEMFFDDGRRELEGVYFSYVEDPKISHVKTGLVGHAGVREGGRGIPSGGITVSVEGENFDVIREPRMYVTYRDEEYPSEPCNVINSTLMICQSPRVEVDSSHILDKENGLDLEFGMAMDNVPRVRDLRGPFTFHMFPNPKYETFEEEDHIKIYKADYLTINGENLNLASQAIDVKVNIGRGHCNVTSLSRSQLTCRPPKGVPRPLPGDRLPRVIVSTGGNLNYTIGYLDYTAALQAGSLPKHLIIGLSVGAAVIIFILCICLIVYKRKSNQNSRVLKGMQEQMDILELRVAAECKEAFAELQTEMTDLTSDLIGGGIPFLDYRTYALKILFPNLEETTKLCIMDQPDLQRKEKGLKLFGQLILNKTFLLLFIRTLETNRYFSMRDRVNVASYIMVVLQGRMEYCSDILKTLLAELIEKCIEGKIHPKLLFRRTESVAEKMLSSWFTFLLFKFLKECAGEPLYLLYRAIKQQVDKGPVDAVSFEARYSLSEEKLIRQSIEYKELTVHVGICQPYNGGYDVQMDSGETVVKVLDCDTISQVKDKALDTIFRFYPYSQRPRREELDLEWRTGTSGRLILYDEDTTTRPEGGWKKLNTLSHYHVPEYAQLTLIPKQASMYNFMTLHNDKSEKSHFKYETLNLTNKYSSASPPLSRATSPLNHENDTGSKTGPKVWHLVRQPESEQKEGERTNKMVSEIYLTRLLSTKLTLQKFVDDLFETIFSIAHRGSALPLAIKYMFDFLDDQALQHGITDPEVVHTWKSNSLPLRFWVNLIKNPNFVFDIHKSNIVDACLSVVAQTFMDSCSTSEHRLGKDSPSSKLLYAKDIPIYKEWVDRYYTDIKMMQPISDQDMNAMLAEESRMHSGEFNSLAALNDLYNYAARYNEQLLLTLEEDEFSRKNRLAYKLEQVHSIMSPENA